MNSFNDLKFSLKLWLFAGIMILAIVFSNGFGIVVNKVTDQSVAEFEGVLEINEEFAAKIIDHHEWAGVIENALISNAKEVAVQTDPTKCNLGRFLIQNEDRLLQEHPDIAPALRSLHPNHNHLHESAVEIKTHWRQVHRGLKSTLSERLDDHRVWVANVSKSLLENRTIEVQTDPSKCLFGSWLLGDEVRQLRAEWDEFDHVISEILEPHRKLHESVHLINATDTYEEKVAVFNSQTSMHVEEVAQIFQRLQNLEDELEQGQSRVNEIYNDKTKVYLSGTQKNLIEIEDLLKGKQNAISERLGKTLSASSVLNVVVLVVSVALAVAVSLLIISLVTRPLKKCEVFANQLAEGDFTAELEVDQKDEIGILAMSLNRMVRELRAGFTDIKEGVQSLASSSTELSAISTQLAGNSEQSRLTAANVAAATEQSSLNMNSVASSVEEMSSGIRSVATASEEMTATIDEIARNAEKGRSITQDAVQKVEMSAKQMEELGVAAKLIGSITDTIKGISEQTNLLALNATIEAASAGEAGKGFAVVANEIKDLSRQTADATEQIRQSIESIQSTTEVSIAEIDGIVSIIGEIDSITSMIATAVEQQSSTTTEIANNITQTADGVNEVTLNVTQVSDATIEVSKGINEVSTASSEIASSSGQIQTSAQELSEFAEKLNEISSRYKV